LIISNLKSLLSLNTAMSEFSNKLRENISPSLSERKESQTSLDVPQKEDSSPLKSKGKEYIFPQTKNISSTKLEPQAVSPSSPTPLTTFLKKWNNRIILVSAYLKGRLAIKLLRWRNRPKKILKYPDPRLLKPSEPITKFDKETQNLIRQLGATLYNQRWGGRLGIAAPQIGVNKRVFLAFNRVFINPEFRTTKAPPEDMMEGCYSLGKDIYIVPRAPYGWARWQDSEGKWREEKFKGLEAIIFQHELDHLNGLLCVAKGRKYEPPKKVEYGFKNK